MKKIYEHDGLILKGPDKDGDYLLKVEDWDYSSSTYLTASELLQFSSAIIMETLTSDFIIKD